MAACKDLWPTFRKRFEREEDETLAYREHRERCYSTGRSAGLMQKPYHSRLFSKKGLARYGGLWSSYTLVTHSHSSVLTTRAAFSVLIDVD